MKSSHTPTKHAIPFGQNGNKRDIPQETKTGSGEASLSLGFPPETMVPKVSGGIPPSGKDFNGILNELSSMGRWANAGAGYQFDDVFASAIGGYPAGAKIPNSENSGFWLNTVDNNLDNPEVTDGRLTGWVPAENYGIATLSGLAKTDVTLTALQAAKARIVLTGDLKANVAVIFPAWQKSWTVVNQCTGSGSLICRTKAGAGVVVPKGESREIVGDGSGLVQRIVNATTSVAGIAQLSSVTNSGSETMAATPKAVKAIADTLSGGRLLNIQSFTRSGIYTPTPGTRKIRVKCWGAGGGGAGMSKQNRVSVSGAAGAYAEALLDATSFSSVSVEVGTGGATAPAGVSQDGGDGGGSSFGTLVTCGGGAGGIVGQGLAKGGEPSGGNVMMVGGQAGQGGSYTSGILSNGVGGASFGGYNALPHVSLKGDDGSFPGGGGAIGSYVNDDSQYAAGKGGDGFIILEEYS